MRDDMASLILSSARSDTKFLLSREEKLRVRSSGTQNQTRHVVAHVIQCRISGLQRAYQRADSRLGPPVDLAPSGEPRDGEAGRNGHYGFRRKVDRGPVQSTLGSLYACPRLQGARRCPERGSLAQPYGGYSVDGG